jgi:hypothetical protein
MLVLRRFCCKEWVWPERFIRTLWDESHRITDPFTLSLSSFYTLHYIRIITSCVAIPSPKMFSPLQHIGKHFMNDVTFSGDSQGRRAGILTARWYSIIHSTISHLLRHFTLGATTFRIMDLIATPSINELQSDGWDFKNKPTRHSLLYTHTLSFLRNIDEIKPQCVYFVMHWFKVSMEQ